MPGRAPSALAILAALLATPTLGLGEQAGAGATALEAEPADTEPAEAEPAEAEPADTEPADTEPAEPPEVAEARLHFEQGLRLVERERWAAALVEFEASLRLHPTRAALLNRGLCLYRLDRFMEALDALESFLELHGGVVDAEQRRQVEAMVSDLRGLLTAVELRVNVEGAEVLVDDIEVGRSPLSRPVLLISGLHDVEVRREGYRPERRQVVVVAGEAAVESFELVAPTRRGRVWVDSDVRGAAVLVSGARVGRTPWEGELPAGPYEIEVRAEGYRTAAQVVEVAPGGRVRAVLSLASLQAVHRVWFWSAVSVASLSALTMAGLGTAALALDARYDRWAEDAEQRYDQGRGLMLGADVALGVAAAAAAAALVLAFFTDWSSGVPAGPVSAGTPAETP